MSVSSQPLKLHHTAIVVRDLKRSTRFYEEHFGGVLENIIENVSDPNVAMLHQLPNARFTLAFMRFGPTRLELFQFEEPSDAKRISRRANDYGLAHICFECPDVDRAYGTLTEAGITFTREPYVVPDGDGAGTVLVFCLDPDGNLIELLQHPTGGRNQ
jgi:catechol 2,3-dioxygenase-like lactoylglutathione lyase family enzyme